MTEAPEVLRTRLLAGCSVQERRLDLAGTETLVLEGGKGPPLVLLHGAIECGGICWAKVIPALAERYRVIVPDVPGLGESAPFPKMDLAHFVAWFDALLGQTCSEPPLLVAHSMNGSMAAHFAAQARPDALRRLVISGGPGVGRNRVSLGLVFAGIRFAMRPTMSNMARISRWGFVPPDAAGRTDREWFETLQAYVLSRAKVGHVKRTMRQLMMLGGKQLPEAELRRITMPTMLIWGRQDRMVPVTVAEQAHAKVGWPLQVLEDVGHFPQVDRPDAFVAAVRAAFE